MAFIAQATRSCGYTNKVHLRGLGISRVLVTRVRKAMPLALGGFCLCSRSFNCMGSMFCQSTSLEKDWLFNYEYWQSDGSVIPGQIILKNIPPLQEENSQCRRAYSYEFASVLPPQDVLVQIARNLNKTFLFPKEKYELADDEEVELSVEISRVHDHEAKIRTSTTCPEECWVVLHVLRELPKLIENELGTIYRIQKQPREAWIQD